MTVWISNIKSKENMKRIFNALGLMLAATLTLTNCTKNIETPVVESEGVPFEIVASTVETKTVNDGMSTLWATGDKINLFHAVAGTTTYKNDNAFTVSDVNSGLFKGTLTSAPTSGNYDWYAFYPYSANLSTPKNTTSYAYIGNKNGITQNGYGSMKHISGTNCPLYGVAKNVPFDEVPSMEMQHLSTVLAVTVKNGLDTPLIVNTVSFAADEDLVGSFYIDFSGDEVTYKASGTNYVDSKATVTVNGGTELAKGQSAVVYLVIKPFTAASGDRLSLVVNGAAKEITLTENVTFAAGHIKNLNYEYTAAAAAKKVTVSEFIEAPESDTQLYEVTGTIVGIDEINAQYNNATINIADEDGNEVKLYRMKAAEGGAAINKLGLSLGDQLTAQGYRSSYNGTPQMAQGGVYVSHIDACTAPVITCNPDNVVTITCAEDDAQIYFKRDNGEFEKYTEPFEITATTVVTAYATAAGFIKSITVSTKCEYTDPNAGTKYFVKVTSAPSDWNGTYLIVYEAGKLALDGSRTTLDAVGNNKTVTISNSMIEATDAMKAISFEITDGNKVRSASGYYIGQTSNANGLKSSKTTVYTNTFSINTDGSANLVSGGAYLRYNASSDQKRFRYYKSSTYSAQKAIALYKLED